MSRKAVRVRSSALYFAGLQVKHRVRLRPQPRVAAGLLQPVRPWVVPMAAAVWSPGIARRIPERIFIRSTHRLNRPGVSSSGRSLFSTASRISCSFWWRPSWLSRSLPSPTLGWCLRDCRPSSDVRAKGGDEKPLRGHRRGQRADGRLLRADRVGEVRHEARVRRRSPLVFSLVPTF
jgi:hypothetical protein